MQRRWIVRCNLRRYKKKHVQRRLKRSTMWEEKSRREKKIFVRIDIKYICLFTSESRECRFSVRGIDLITAVTCSHIMRNDRNVIYWSLPSESKALELALSRFLTSATRKSSHNKGKEEGESMGPIWTRAAAAAEVKVNLSACCCCCS